MPEPLLIAVALGDPTGIGPEITLRAVAAELPADDSIYLLVGDEACMRRWNERLNLGLPLHACATGPAASRVLIHQPEAVALPASLPCGAPPAARAAMAWLKAGAEHCLGGRAAALVTAPVNKHAIIEAGFRDFVGQTELLAHLSGGTRPTMMLLGPDERGRWLRVALATTHLPLKRVPAELTRQRVELAIERAAGACRDLGLPRARVGVCGLNPHAGERGSLGDEEVTIVAPAVAAARGRNLEAVGPLAADTLFHQALRGDYDAVVAMYHDQGLAPLKMVAFDQGVNWTLGLPFIRTSPDHGTAYDLAGRGQANPSSMRAALRLARQLARSRSTARPAEAPLRPPQNQRGAEENPRG
jgi:4-hydroxythreonine-4-phosphate dehydrogenase